MRVCKLIVKTRVDGAEQKIVRMGKIESLDDGTRILYKEENATVQMTLRENEAILEREGEYSLRLPLTKGERTVGVLDFAGSAGDISVETYEIAFEQGENCLNATLRYALLFGEEKQDMLVKIRGEV